MPVLLYPTTSFSLVRYTVEQRTSMAVEAAVHGIKPTAARRGVHPATRPLKKAWDGMRSRWRGYAGRSYILEDGNRIHAGKGNRKWRDDRGWAFLPHPAYSPGLNPIEHAWAKLKRRLGLLPERPRGKEALAAKLKEIWDEIPNSFFAALMESMPRRLCAVLRSYGGATKC